jgi:hypothetical protein
MSAPASRLAPTLILLWGIVAALAVWRGLLWNAPFPPPVFVGAGVLFLLAAAVVVPGFAAWMKQVDIRLLLGFHLVRFVGLYFLWLATVGRLDPTFALTAGIGDLIAAVGATGLLLFPDLRDGKWLLVWNIVGLADILLVVVTAARIFATAPADLAELAMFPLGLLPTFVVPLIIVSHLVVFLRLRVKPAA